MFRNVCAAAAACFLLGQCAGTAVRIMPEYKRMNVEKSRLGIVFLTEGLTIHNPADIVGDLGEGEANRVFSDFFASHLMEFAIKDGTFKGVDVANASDTSGFISITEYLSSEKRVSVRVPRGKAFMGDSLPFLLIFDGVDVSREKKVGTEVVVLGTSGIPIRKRTGDLDRLILKGSFMLWDNPAGKAAAFGQFNEKIDVLSSQTKTALINGIKNISSEIFINRPFGKQSAPPR